MELHEQAAVLEDQINNCESAALSPTTCAEQLNASLSILETQAARTARQNSLLNLIRRAKIRRFAAYAASQQLDKADSTLRSLISVRPFNQYELLDLGPALAARVEAQTRKVEALPHGTLHVFCQGPCSITVNDSLVNIPAQLPIGTYRLAVSGLTRHQQSLVETFEIRFDGQEHRFDLPAPPTHAPPGGKPVRLVTPVVPASDPSAPKLGFDRNLLDKEGLPKVLPLLPRKPLRIGIASSVLVATAGTFLLALNGQCMDYKAVQIEKDGPYIAICKDNEEFNGIAFGTPLLAVGLTGLLTGVTLLVIERIRGKRLGDRWLKEAQTPILGRLRRSPRRFSSRFPLVCRFR